MGWFSQLFKSLTQRSGRHDQVAAYVIREHGEGRDIDEILDDPYVKNRATETQRRQLLERPDVIRAVGGQLRPPTS
jgi:hypothetical protein